MVKKNTTQKREPREMRLVSEYLAIKYGKYPNITRARLGGIHPALMPEKLSAEERRLVTVWKRWCDALVFLPRKTILIEAAILPTPADISILENYGFLFKRTPEYEDYWKKPLELLLLYSISDPVVVKMARDRKIKVDQFFPDWLTPYIRGLQRRKQRPPLQFPEK